MPKLTFENLHPTKFAAFTDGVLTTLVVLWFARKIRNHC